MRALWLAPALALTLSACGADPVDERRGDVRSVILAANDGDAAGLRNAVAELRATVRAQVASGELDRPEGERLNAIALRLLENAGLLDAPAPSPSPAEEQTEEPSPEPEPSPSPEEEEPEPSPSPEQEEPEPSEEPAPEPEPSEEPLLPVEESPPAMQSQGSAPGASPQPSAA